MIIKTYKLDSLRLDFLLFFIYLFSLIDLVLTYFGVFYFHLSELNPIHHYFGWFGLTFSKLFFPLIFYFLSLKLKSYFPLYFMLGLVIFVCYWNLTLLFYIR